MLKNAWSFRNLALNFFQRELTGRYVGSINGLFWILIHPLALLGIYSVVFDTIFKVTAPVGDYSFIAFVALGLWPWLSFQEGVQRGALSVQANAGLLKKVAFPNELLVYAAVAATYTIHGIGFIAALVVLAVSGNVLHYEALPIVALILIAQFIFTLGLSSILAALQVMLKDIEHLLSPMMMIWFYATPVLYSVTMVPVQVQKIMLLNPMVYFIQRTRELLMSGGGLIWNDGVIVLSALCVFIAGRWFFNRLASHFEDFV
ncbi:MAG: ABC transporter permease [Pseudomonadota bacterium]